MGKMSASAYSLKLLFKINMLFLIAVRSCTDEFLAWNSGFCVTLLSPLFSALLYRCPYGKE